MNTTYEVKPSNCPDTTADSPQDCRGPFGNVVCLTLCSRAPLLPETTVVRYENRVPILREIPSDKK